MGRKRLIWTGTKGQPGTRYRFAVRLAGRVRGVPIWGILDIPFDEFVLWGFKTRKEAKKVMDSRPPNDCFQVPEGGFYPGDTGWHSLVKEMEEGRIQCSPCAGPGLCSNPNHSVTASPQPEGGAGQEYLDGK
jgi:hypothetical protein